jgi:N-acetyl-anhydromuramyl-L-alanine amidase AmpD/subtilisin family serine protease
MDPALHEYIFSETHEADIEAIVRLVRPDTLPEGISVVAQFGDIATCRLPISSVESVWGDEAVLSLKAPRLVQGEPSALPDNTEAEAVVSTLSRSHSGDFTGKGVALGVIDWGFDFTHPNFIEPETGSTRFLSFWDQTAPAHPSAGKYGYGRIYSREEINAALKTDMPFNILGYNPAIADIANDGTHGTHVMDIAAGNGSVGEPGMAPGSDLIGVHLSAGHVDGLANLGDSVRILEAIDFLAGIADKQALVINMSVGKHGGSHQGNSLVELGMDNFLKEKPGRAIINSAGNYYNADIHASGRVAPGHSSKLRWDVDKSDITPNELEVWYPGRDEFILSVKPPGGKYAPYVVKLGDKKDIVHRKETAGRIYHRKSEPNTGHHHIDIFLYRNAPKGIWEITLEGADVVDGRFHAWIERDSGCINCQSRFVNEDADPQYTTGSICNGLYTIAVGAFDSNDPSRRPSAFSSSGPTTDGRQKPNLLAPGVNIRAARSAPAGAVRSVGELTTKTGTSMAAPYVTGAVACLFEAAGQLLPIEATRRLLLANLEAHTENISGVNYQFGLGVLDIPSLLQSFQAARESIKEMNNKLIYPVNENDLTMPTSIGFAEQQVGVSSAANLRIVLSGNAIIRTAPPDVRSTGRRLNQYSLVEVTQTQTHGGRVYVQVNRPLPPGTQGPSQVLGWTLESNLESNDAATINWATVKSELVRIANREYDAWNVPNITFETNSRNFPEQKAYWGTVGVRPTDAQLGDNVWQNGVNDRGGHFWSAAFISYVVQQAGAGTHFCYNASHSCYIVCARQNREYSRLHNPFWAYPIDDPIAAWPEPGDIVCKNRNGGTLTLAGTSCGNSSHCDIVVEVDRERRQMITVGGNVDNRVARRIVRLTVQGLIDATQLWEIENAGTRQLAASRRSQDQYFAIIKVRTDIAALPAIATGRGGVAAEGNDFSALETLAMTTHPDGWSETASELEADTSIFMERDGIDAYADNDVADDFESYEDHEAQETDFEAREEEYDEFENYPEENGYADCGCSHIEREQDAVETHKGQHENCRECGEFWLEQAQDAFVNPLIGFSARSNDAARLFDAITYGKGSNIAAVWQERYQVECAPRTVLGAALLPGDILLERSFGDGKGHISLITKGELQTNDTLSDPMLNTRALHPGYFVEVMDGVQSYARRIADSHGRLPANIMVLRPRPIFENTPGTPDNLNWAENREDEIAALKNQVVMRWGSADEVVDPVFFMVYPEWAGKDFSRLSQPEKNRYRNDWVAIANELIRDRRERVVLGGLIPSLGGHSIPLGLKLYKNNKGLWPDPNLRLYNTGRLDMIIADLHRLKKINITQDELDIFQRIANVESSGYIHTLNTWDSAIVSIGFMQFTLHSDKIQEWIKLNESAFRRYGIELDPNEKYTFITEKRTWDVQAIKGIPDHRKNELRWNGWAERFYYAGLDEDIIISQVQLAKKYLVNHLRDLKTRLENKPYYDKSNAKYLLFKSRYYDKDAYVRGLFQESHNHNPSISTRAVFNALENMRSEDTTLTHFLEKYKEQLIDAGKGTIVAKTATGATIALVQATTVRPDEAWSYSQQTQPFLSRIADQSVFTESRAATLEVSVRTDFLARNGAAVSPHYRPGVNIRGAQVVINGTGIQGITNSTGEVRLNINTLADGDYTLTVTHSDPARNTSNPAGPQLAESPTAAPDSIFLPLTVNISIQSGSLIRATVPAGTLHGGVGHAGLNNFTTSRLPLDWKPSWWAAPTKSGEGTRTGGYAQIDKIIVHHTGGNIISGAVNTFRNVSQIASIHYIIDLNGHIIKMNKDITKVNHAGCSHWHGLRNLGATSIGIEIVNQSGPYTVAQYQSLIRLLGGLLNQYQTHLPARNILGHSDIATEELSDRTCTSRIGTRRITDPGSEFEWEQLERLGWGIIPAPTASLTGLYGDYFSNFTIPLREGDNDRVQRYGGVVRSSITTAIIQDLQRDLAAIGYSLRTNGIYDNHTSGAVKAFQMHFFSGSRRKELYGGTGAFNQSRYDRELGRINEVTARMIQRVLTNLPRALTTSPGQPIPSVITR